jgi:cytochrome P450
MDFWSDEVIETPYGYYKTLRDLGPAVWLTQHSAWVVTRHESLREALLNGEVFSSAKGCMMNEPTNAAFAGVMLCSDDPEHRALRRVFSRPFTPAALAPLRRRLVELVEARVDELVARGRFDAVTDLAHLLPMTIVTELVGLSDEGKQHMLRWAAAIFDAFGPDSHARTLRGMEIMGEAFAYTGKLKREELDPDGWGAALFLAADRGEIPAQTAKAMLMDYLGPALDTTINATSSAVALFAAHPDQWDLVRADLSRIPAVIDEVLRLESPIRGFSRYVTRDYDLCGVQLKAGDRAVMLYASGNRDERRYENPEQFDIRRNARDHLGFGYGTHICAGMNLAKLELTVVLEALARRVRRFQVLSQHRELNNTLRGIARLDVVVEAAG